MAFAKAVMSDAPDSALTSFAKVVNQFFEIGAPRRARGYFGAAERLRDFEIL
jgi:hypothetical protein